MCNLDKDLLQKYIDKDIEPLEKILVDNHLATCSQCRKDLNQLKVMEWDLNNIDLPKVPKDLVIVRHAALDKYFEAIDTRETSSGTKNIMNLQYKNLKHIVSFVNYLPGKKTIEASFKKTATKNTKQTKNKSLLSKIIGL